MLKSHGPMKGRIYVSLKDDSKVMTLREYYCKAKQMEKRFEKLSMEEKESQILNMRIKDPMYAPDVNFNVLSKEYNGFNLHKLPNLLDNYVKQYGHALGITTPLSYIGAIGSRFAWHVEDMNLYSISIMLFGDAKVWYTIPNKHGPKFEALQEEHKIWPAQPCSHPLRHKTNCFDPNFVKSNGIEVFKVFFILIRHSTYTYIHKYHYMQLYAFFSVLLQSDNSRANANRCHGTGVVPFRYESRIQCCYRCQFRI